MNDEKLRIGCAEFIAKLDPYLDGELDDAIAHDMRAHADACEACAKKLTVTERMLSLMRGMDDDIVAPLSARSAWRRAVKENIQAKKRRRFVRAFSGIAAAFVVMFGCTVLFRQTGLLNAQLQEDALLAAPTYSWSADEYERRIATYEQGAQEAAPMSVMSLKSRSVDAGIVVQTDGDNLDEAIVTTDDTLEFTMDAENTAPMRVTSAERVAQTEAFDRERQAISDLAEEYGGYIARESVDQSAKLRVANYLIRVPAEDFSAFFAALDNVGRTITVDQYSTDVSEYYYDAQSRLQSERMIVERLNALISTADESKLAELNTQLETAYGTIDDLEKCLRAYESDIRYSEITLTLKEVSPLPAVTPEPSLGERSASGFQQSLSSIGNFFGDMVVSMSIIAPAAGILLALALIVLGAVCLIKKRKQKESAS